MTTLNWRLKELPTAEGVARLVEQGVLSVEEAREILFSNSKVSFTAYTEHGFTTTPTSDIETTA